MFCVGEPISIGVEYGEAPELEPPPPGPRMGGGAELPPEFDEYYF